MSEPILVIEKLSLEFGGLKAIHEFSVSLNAGNILGVVGPNGAGKTSLLNCLAGLYRPTSGRILLDSVDIAKKAAHEIVRRGLARTFQHVELMPTATVAENILTARHHLFRRSLAFSALYYGLAAREERANREVVQRIAEAVGISSIMHQPAGEIDLAQQKLVALARALASEPKVLLLDEPTSGLYPEERQSLAPVLDRLRQDFKLSLILVEHDLEIVRRLCRTVVVMNFGEKIAEGAADVVLDLPVVRTAYFGMEDEEGVNDA